MQSSINNDRPWSLPEKGILAVLIGVLIWALAGFLPEPMHPEAAAREQGKAAIRPGITGMAHIDGRALPAVHGCVGDWDVIDSESRVVASRSRAEGWGVGTDQCPSLAVTVPEDAAPGTYTTRYRTNDASSGKRSSLFAQIGGTGAFETAPLLRDGAPRDTATGYEHVDPDNGTARITVFVDLGPKPPAVARITATGDGSSAFTWKWGTSATPSTPTLIPAGESVELDVRSISTTARYWFVEVSQTSSGGSYARLRDFRLWDAHGAEIAPDRALSRQTGISGTFEVVAIPEPGRLAAPGR